MSTAFMCCALRVYKCEVELASQEMVQSQTERKLHDTTG